MINRFIERGHRLKAFFSLVLTGNGPSAITLSYLLSGHVPYYRGNSSDDFLHLRLSENLDQPLVLQDLEFLSDVSDLILTFRKQNFIRIILGFGGPIHQSSIRFI